MTQQITVVPNVAQPIDISGVEQALVMGDLAGLTEPQRLRLYHATCESLGLNPLTRPFDYVKFPQGGMRLYPNKSAAEQLRVLRRISLQVVQRETANGVHIVIVRATSPDGRTDESAGVVAIENLRGDALATAMMKAETKAKRRATLSICGLIALDETDQGERDLPAGATVVLGVDTDTGEVTEQATDAHLSRYQPPRPDVTPSYDQDGNQKTTERGDLLWCAGPVECYLSQSPDKSRSLLKSTGRCPLPEHHAVMFANLTGPIRWGHAVRGEDTCWLDESQKRAAAREAEAMAVLDEQLPFTDAEEAAAVAGSAPFARSGSV